jgi:hypothetical protein
VSVDDGALRSLVRELLAEALESPASSDRDGAVPVRIANDADLRDFALRVLELAGDPQRREALRAGAISFTLTAGPAAPAAAAAPANGRELRIERGALTEKAVAAAARDGSSIVLGKRAVATPLALDKARSLGVNVQKEAT